MNQTNLRSFKYNLRRHEYVYPYLKLTLINRDSSHGDILQPINEIYYQTSIQAKCIATLNKVGYVIM